MIGWVKEDDLIKFKYYTVDRKIKTLDIKKELEDPDIFSLEENESLLELINLLHKYYSNFEASKFEEGKIIGSPLEVNMTEL